MNCCGLKEIPPYITLFLCNIPSVEHVKNIFHSDLNTFPFNYLWYSHCTTCKIPYKFLGVL